MRHKVDFLVIGSGIAGLSFAIKVADHGKVIIIAKDKAEETATKYAQGGIAAVMYTPDTYEKHIQDTLTAGDGMCNPEAEPSAPLLISPASSVDSPRISAAGPAHLRAFRSARRTEQLTYQSKPHLLTSPTFSLFSICYDCIVVSFYLSLKIGEKIR